MNVYCFKSGLVGALGMDVEWTEPSFSTYSNYFFDGPLWTAAWSFLFFLLYCSAIHVAISEGSLVV